MEQVYRSCETSQPQIGRLVGGLDYAAVSQARKRVHKILVQDDQLRERFEEMHNPSVQLSRGKI